VRLNTQTINVRNNIALKRSYVTSKLVNVVRGVTLENGDCAFIAMPVVLDDEFNSL
jgi:hypothetical protein